MANRTIQLTDALHDYLLSHSLDEPEVLRLLREETANDSMSVMQIAPDQGQFMQLLVRLSGARRLLEIGTYTGYSSLCFALALPADGHITACDINKEWTDIAKRYWQQAGVDEKIELKLAPALETLDELLKQGQAGSYDFIFIDADKQNYLNYYERSFELLREGGLMVIDNVLWGGAVADPSDNDSDTVAIRALNEHVSKDNRVELSMLPVGDGLSLVRKKPAV